MTEIKAAGKGEVEHYPEMEQADLQKMYGSVHLDCKTPTGLANRVQLNIRLYFCRRGNENMHTMTKTTFIVKQYADTNRKYILKNADELSKNHREADKEKITGHMPSDPTDPENCPVQMFEKYISKLHPNCDRHMVFGSYRKTHLPRRTLVGFKNDPLDVTLCQKFCQH